MNAFIRFLVLIILVSALPATGKTAETVQIGFRPTVVTAEGVPANDMIGIGLFGRYRLSERWLVGAALDKAAFDFELPWKIVGLTQAAGVEPIDAEAEALIISAWLERESGGRVWKTFWSVGAGVTSPDVQDVPGPVQGGGTFDLVTDPGTEVLLLGAAGIRRLLGDHFALEFALRADHHLAEWKVRDRVSGRTGTTGDYTALGAHLGMLFRF